MRLAAGSQISKQLRNMIIRQCLACLMFNNENVLHK